MNRVTPETVPVPDMDAMRTACQIGYGEHHRKGDTTEWRVGVKQWLREHGVEYAKHLKDDADRWAFIEFVQQ